ncbi:MULTISPECIES: M20 metallopeptidase family protein [unclassified Arthrobacter]|uniref:M20 metallopeptidase family protein n=1 Tax=unclassified Arthrobacter TaxID=235627 RepID=UPI001D151120|nr:MULTISPECIES: M20 family metallopeptidase [unclassified Arthrobacter]MCC3275227.1 M20 family metallopeptidase [Arthrobacter sp. zg-Y20]MCC9176673.1 M20 family metallopeptidase [Arthrobacter sp. zg-Y750]MDK1315384.1 M20 family metallopeptidase [Arthrobacter sp. zg.Y20]WIB05801.1 M20 family metallopeptidase [Arthrobacter sp. zg-Y20]
MFVEEAQAILPELVALRRSLHREPETGLDLPLTQEKILAALEGLDLEITLGMKSTSVVAVLRGAEPGPVVLLRGDMDALPVAELTDLDYASTNGNMHACGHDLHVAGLVGAARLLSAQQEDLSGSVVFMFQPGEEGHDGASAMIAEGVLDAAGQRPVAAYGIHVRPGPLGVFRTKPGTLMAGANELRITVKGSGGHSSQPQTAIDPVPALTEIATALQTMTTRRFSAFDPVVLTVTQLSAGEAINVIPDTASLGASVRTLSEESLDRVIIESKALAEGIASAHGCTAEVDFTIRYPVTTNDAGRTREAVTGLREIFGEERVQESRDPLMGSEDFSLILNEVPGTFIFLGATPPSLNPVTAAWNHSPRVVFDDSVLGDQAAALAQLAYNQLT